MQLYHVINCHSQRNSIQIRVTTTVGLSAGKCNTQLITVWGYGWSRIIAVLLWEQPKVEDLKWILTNMLQHIPYHTRCTIYHTNMQFWSNYVLMAHWTKYSTAISNYRNSKHKIYHDIYVYGHIQVLSSQPPKIQSQLLCCRYCLMLIYSCLQFSLVAFTSSSRGNSYLGASSSSWVRDILTGSM